MSVPNPVTKPTPITRRNAPMNIVGSLPEVGSQAPALTNLTKTDWKMFQMSSCPGKHAILNIYLGISTPTCSKTVKRFNEEAQKLSNAVVLCISKDLPSSLADYCGAKQYSHIIPLSAYHEDCNFGDAYGVRIIDGDGPEKTFKGLFGRALVVIDPQGKVIYSELVTELANEPNYDAALKLIPKAAVDSKIDAESQKADSAGKTESDKPANTAATAKPTEANATVSGAPILNAAALAAAAKAKPTDSTATSTASPVDIANPNANKNKSAAAAK